jgi:hypothetical protein
MIGQNTYRSDTTSSYIDWVQRGAVQLQYISTAEQVADILSKSLPRDKHVYFRDKMGVVSNTFPGKREC